MSNPSDNPPALPFTVPPFDYGGKTSYELWGWHPNYPYWSKSCWESTTEEGARAMLPHLHLYMTALVKCENGCYSVIEMVPPDAEGLKVWQKVAARTSK